MDRWCLILLQITDIIGHEAPLNDDVDQLTITYDLAQIPQLDTVVSDDEIYHQGFTMIEGRSIVTEPESGQQFRILTRDDESTQDTGVWKITALHVLHDLNDKFQEDKFDGVLSANDAMNRIVKDTKFSFTIHDNLPNKTVSGFGYAHALNMFISSFLGTYGAEFTVNNYHIDIYKKVGIDNAFVFVDGGNIQKIGYNYDDTTITTHVKGIGKNDDNGNPTIKSEYTSDNAKYYGVVDADFFQDDSITDQATLDAKTKSSVQDYPLMQLTCEYHEFQRGIASDLDISGNNKIAIGNSGFVRDRDLIDVNTRIVKLQIFPQSDVQEPLITFGNVIGDFNTVLAKLNSNASNDAKLIEQIKAGQSNSGNSDINTAWTSEEVDGFVSNL